MKNFESNYIEKIIDIMKNNELTEITLGDDKSSLFIKSNGYKPIIKEKEVIEEEIIEPIEEEIIEEKQNLIPIKSNLIGMFFSKPSPNEEPFIRVGDEIKEGQTICIIDTIKLMNKITSDVSGKVVEICIEDGKPVEYGQVMMYIEQ